MEMGFKGNVRQMQDWCSIVDSVSVFLSEDASSIHILKPTQFDAAPNFTRASLVFILFSIVIASILLVSSFDLLPPDTTKSSTTKWTR